MPKRMLILCLVLCTSLFAQLESNSVTVTASRSAILQPDQVLLSVTVSTGLDGTLDDVLAALKPLGISLANLTNLYGNSEIVPITAGPFTPPPQISWTFGFSVPLSKMKETLAALAGLQHDFKQAKNGLTLSFSVQGTQVSEALQQTQACSIPDLIADARAQAQKLASAGGLVAGPILAMSTISAAIPSASFVSGAFSAALLTVPQSCVLTVKFALTRF